MSSDQEVSPAFTAPISMNGIENLQETSLEESPTEEKEATNQVFLRDFFSYRIQLLRLDFLWSSW